MLELFYATVPVLRWVFPAVVFVGAVAAGVWGYAPIFQRARDVRSGDNARIMRWDGYEHSQARREAAAVGLMVPPAVVLFGVVLPAIVR